MNVRKRGLALLLCVCMIFTLLPFSALAADSDDVVYGQYDENGKWTPSSTATASKTYKDETTGANIEYSKEAKATGTPNVYDVTLTIKNTTTKTAPGASAVVLVIDTSKSMESYNRIGNAKQAAKNFAESYGATGGDRYLAVVSFNNSASAQNFGTTNAPVYWLNVSDSANLSKVQTAINGMGLNRNTNLSAGLSSAKNLFDDSTVSSITDFKYAVVLTDGEPNVSDVSGEWNAYNAAAQRATELKNAGCEVYTVGVSLGDTAETFLQTKVASSTDKAYTTNNADELNNIFSEIFKEIEKGITSGFTVSDPMGDYAVLQNETLPDCEIVGNGLTWTPKTGERVTNSDGSTTTTYTLTYQVKLDVDRIPNDGTYPLNGVTTLTFGDKTLNFNVPGVKGIAPRYDYTIKYMWGDTVLETETGSDKAGTEITKSPKTIDGYTPVSDDEKTLTISADGENVLVFNYYKDVKLVANSGTFTYDGTEKTVEGYKAYVGSEAVNAVFDGVSASGKGTNAGTYLVKFSADPADKVDTNDLYIVKNATPGTLTIDKADTVTVTIKGATKTVTYNGAEQFVDGWTSNAAEVDASITVTLNEGSEAKASGTNAGKYNMDLTADDFTVASANYEKINVIVEDGWLEITPAAEATVTIKGATKTVTYNGAEQFVDGWTSNAAEVDASITVTLNEGSEAKASGTNAGKYNMDLTADDFTVASANYEKINVIVEDGWLEITPITDEVVVKITGNTDTVYYNGKEQKVEGFEVNTNGLPITVTLKDGHTAEAKGTKPDTYYMELTATDFDVISQNYSNITLEITDGWLKIKRRPVAPTPDKITVTITGNTDSKVYDGTEQNVNGYTWVSSDPSYTENDFEFTGKADANGTYVGSYDMGITADQFKNINSRYTVEFIVETDGELKITPKPLTITAGSKEGVAPVTCDEWTATETAKGDTIVDVTITGIQPVPGESPNKASNAVIKNEAGTDVTSNYDIIYVDGVLRAIEVLNKEEHFNYVIGYTDGTIRPGNNISRAEIATIFFRLLKDDVREKYMTTDCDFSDVASGAWCRRAIATLTNIGIIHGYTDGTFRPNAQITRAELATIIARFANLDVNTKTFNDITGHWAQKSIELAAGNGWINGYTDGTFRPNNKITRAETFAMINRVLDRQTKSADDLLPQSEMNMWSDNMDESAWYYRDVQEATNYHKCDRVGDSIYEKWTAKITDIDWAVYQI